MTWRKNERGEYERPCRCCAGTGKETLGPWSQHNCADHRHEVEHPANTRTVYYQDVGVTKRLERCDVCGRVWFVTIPFGDDSMDEPAPVCVGESIPDDTWRPSE